MGKSQQECSRTVLRKSDTVKIVVSQLSDFIKCFWGINAAIMSTRLRGCTFLVNLPISITLFSKMAVWLSLLGESFDLNVCVKKSEILFRYVLIIGRLFITGGKFSSYLDVN